MKLKFKLSTFLLFVSLCMACTGNKKSQEIPLEETITQEAPSNTQNVFYFNGEYKISGDITTFSDCLTGNPVNIAAEDQYENVDKAYKTLNPAPEESINCSLMGYITFENPVTNEGKMEMVITNFLGFDKDTPCQLKDNITDNIYANFKPNEEEAKTKTSITFDKNYTFQCSTYQLDPVEQISDFKGEWYRTAKDNIVLLVNGEVLYEGVIEYSSMNLILQNDNEQEVIFQKGK